MFSHKSFFSQRFAVFDVNQVLPFALSGVSVGMQIYPRQS